MLFSEFEIKECNALAPSTWTFEPTKHDNIQNAVEGIKFETICKASKIAKFARWENNAENFFHDQQLKPQRFWP